MCLQDVSMGLKSKGLLRQVLVTTTRTTLAGVNSKRRSLIIRGSDLTAFTVSTDPRLVSTQGILVRTDGGQLELTVEKHGSIVGETWYGIVGAGTAQVAVLEVTLDEDEYQAARKQSV